MKLGLSPWFKIKTKTITVSHNIEEANISMQLIIQFTSMLDYQKSYWMSRSWYIEYFLQMIQMPKQKMKICWAQNSIKLNNVNLSLLTIIISKVMIFSFILLRQEIFKWKELIDMKIFEISSFSNHKFISRQIRITF